MFKKPVKEKKIRHFLFYVLYFIYTWSACGLPPPNVKSQEHAHLLRMSHPLLNFFFPTSSSGKKRRRRPAEMF